MPSIETARITPLFGLKAKLESELVDTIEEITGQIGQMSIFQKELDELEIPSGLIENVRSGINSAFRNKGLGAELNNGGLKIVTI